jgi:H+-translocating NAD(P) transhydrogenase subunit alpha
LGVTVGVLKEVCQATGHQAERRVATVPRVVDAIRKLGAEVMIESRAGESAGFLDTEYEAKGAKIAASAADVLQASQILLMVRINYSPAFDSRHTLIGFCDPLGDPRVSQELARQGVRLFSMELVPRTTRAQSMDALSSMASIAGYKAVLLAANSLPRLFPMMTTAAGTITPARVFVIGAGVAGLQAIATARRLGAVVSGYDVREAVKEQIESLGAKFVSITLGANAEGQGGYAAALDEETIRKQREQMAAVFKDQDVVITTAAVPGKKAPLLITRDMVYGMAPGSVIVDLAAERGGNCELTRAGESVVDHGVQILGPVNLASELPYHSSQMYSRNLLEFLKLMLVKGEFKPDTEDSILAETLVARDGAVVHPRVQQLLNEVHA